MSAKRQVKMGIGKDRRRISTVIKIVRPISGQFERPKQGSAEGPVSIDEALRLFRQVLSKCGST